MKRSAATMQIHKIAKTIKKLARKTECEYAMIVENIISEECRDSRHIERTLDGLLDFCFDPSVLILFKKLCRYYFTVDPSATVSYIESYREIWDPDSIPKKMKEHKLFNCIQSDTNNYQPQQK